MPGGGGQYGVMGRHQDPRSSMFGSSLNLNGKHNPIYDNTEVYKLFFYHYFPFSVYFSLFRGPEKKVKRQVM